MIKYLQSCYSSAYLLFVKAEPFGSFGLVCSYSNMNSGCEQSVLHTFLLLCLTGAFSTLLEFVNSGNAAHCWLAECVWFLLESMHWEHLKETDRERGRERQKEREREREREVDWGKENGGASWCLAEQIFSAVCSLFIHGGQLFICCLSGQAETERDGGVRERRRQAEKLGMTWKGCEKYRY